MSGFRFTLPFGVLSLILAGLFIIMFPNLDWFIALHASVWLVGVLLLPYTFFRNSDWFANNLVLVCYLNFMVYQFLWHLS